MRLEELEPLVGEWRTEIVWPGHAGVIAGRTTFEWLDGGGFLVQRVEVDNPAFPRGFMLIGPEIGGESVVQHYFDSRGVARIYDISFANGVWQLWRDDRDFAQRYSGRLSADGTRIEGAWERCDDGATWDRDFDLTYTKVA